MTKWWRSSEWLPWLGFEPTMVRNNKGPLSQNFVNHFFGSFLVIDTTRPGGTKTYNVFYENSFQGMCLTKFCESGPSTVNALQIQAEKYILRCILKTLFVRAWRLKGHIRTSQKLKNNLFKPDITFFYCTKTSTWAVVKFLEDLGFYGQLQCFGFGNNFCCKDLQLRRSVVWNICGLNGKTWENLFFALSNAYSYS